MEWKKISSLNATTEDIQEIWIYKNDNEYHEHNVSIKSGKYLDVLDLKDINLKNYKNEINKVKQTRTVIFRHNHKIERCPICNDFSICSTSILNVYGAIYVKCKTCSHCYIINPPKKKELDKFYAGNAQYQNTYADKEKLEDRVNQVVIPKLEYVIDMYKKQFGREPCSILDIGAGSGHFVYACRNHGLQADGIEISKTGIRFCKENFDIDLIDADFIKTYECFSDYDIITFWGVIEHVPLPLKMLAAAQNILMNIPAKISTLSGRLVPTNPDRSSNDSGLVSISQF
jgi:hypothetical protein